MGPLDISECISFLGVSSMLLFCIRMIPSFAEAWLCILPSFCFQINFWSFIIEDWSSWQYQVYYGYAFSSLKNNFSGWKGYWFYIKTYKGWKNRWTWRLSCHNQITKILKHLVSSALQYFLRKKQSAFSINSFYSNWKFKQFNLKCVHFIFLENIVGTCRLGSLPRNQDRVYWVFGNTEH